MSAGVLPFAVKENGELVFLLGRERERRGRFIGRSHVWCDFGGGVSPKIHSIFGAAREFAEETIGVVVGKGTNSATVDYISSRVCPEQPIRSMFGSSVPYDMYIIEIPYDPLICTRFSQRRRIAEHPNAVHELAGVLPQRCFHKSGRMRDAFLEKDCLRWVTWHELLQYANHHDTLFPLRREFSATIHFYASRIFSAVSARLCGKKCLAQKENAAFPRSHGFCIAATSRTDRCVETPCIAAVAKD